MGFKPLCKSSLWPIFFLIYSCWIIALCFCSAFIEFVSKASSMKSILWCNSNNNWKILKHETNTTRYANMFGAWYAHWYHQFNSQLFLVNEELFNLLIYWHIELLFEVKHEFCACFMIFITSIHQKGSHSVKCE